ncbi:MAG: cytochrome d ubiquinol oxidase subunit II [Solirubrobacterales bacterium]|nr:cytochrome d ubiquinol oxidase subunit II [Solirubrobacterales bacterium]
MHFNEIPLLFVLIGLVLYTVLAGADFGAGFWQLTAGSGERGERIRDHAHHSMATVWEANHVWLIFVLTVFWTAYPTAFGSIASTLCVALFIAAVGIIFRGAAYALRAGTETAREARTVDLVAALSSILTPFALGAAVGGIASRRVPVGNAAGNLITSWLNPTSILIGVLAVATSAYLAAVYLAADAARLGDRDLEQRFRMRALGAGLAGGAIAMGGLVVLHADAHPLYDRLLAGTGLPALIISVLAGLTTLGLVWVRRFEPARYTAALAVAAIIAGWALAQRPSLLPGLTIAQAVAPHETLVAVIIAVLAGAAILFPSLGLLFKLTLSGRLEHGEDKGDNQDKQRPAHQGQIPIQITPARAALSPTARPGLSIRLAAACLIMGVGFLTFAEAGWAHLIGVVALLGFIAIGFVAVAPGEVAEQGTADVQDGRLG